MRHGVRFWIGLGLMAAAGSCAGRHLPPEPDSYVAADAIGADRAAELAASPAASPRAIQPGLTVAPEAIGPGGFAGFGAFGSEPVKN